MQGHGFLCWRPAAGDDNRVFISKTKLCRLERAVIINICVCLMPVSEQSEAKNLIYDL